MDCHHVWHEMAESYMDPETFRMHLNHLIQNLRNITFLLQKRKRDLPEFDSWYSAFRTESSSLQVMKWVVNSRNRVVKESDLELLSQATARITVDWVNQAERKVEAPISASNADILREVVEEVDRLTSLEVGAVTIQRRWVDRTLPDWELLDATREIYFRLASLLLTAHEKAGVNPDTCSLGARTRQCVSSSLPQDAPPACMAFLSSHLRAHYSLSDRGELAESTILLDTGVPSEAAAARFGDLPRSPLVGDPITAASKVLETARLVLEKDKSVVPVHWLYRGERPVQPIIPVFFDQIGKNLSSQYLAEAVEGYRADGVLTVTESWYTTVPRETASADLSGVVPPRHDPGRMEALTVYAVTRDGRARTLMQPFRRTLLRKIRFAPDFTDSETYPNNYLAILRKWEEMKERGI